MKIYVVGDLHGRLDLLQLALDFAVKDSDGQVSMFISLGDMIDRGPDSRGVVAKMMEGNHENLLLHAIQGNHEDMMIKSVLEDKDNRTVAHWRMNGGEATIRSYTGATKSKGNNLWHRRTPEMLQHAAWLQTLPPYLMTDHHFFVHAGPDFGKSLDDQKKSFMQWVRYEGKEDTPLFEGRHVVHGHEQYASGPMLTENRTNLDVYAWLHGQVAVGIFDSEVAGGPIKIEMLYGEPDPELWPSH